MPTEELFGNYMFALNRSLDHDAADQFDIIMDDNAGNELSFDGSDVGIIAVELDAGSKVQSSGIRVEAGSHTPQMTADADHYIATDDLWL